MEHAQGVTRLLQAWSSGDAEAFDRLIEVVYEDLRRIAHRHLRGERGNHTLDTCALVHECYVNLIGKPGGEWQNRAQFYAVASKVMRRILVDYARRRSARKRGGDRIHVTWDGGVGEEERDLDQLLSLDEALTSLAELDPRLGDVVECRFFGGMSTEETARALDVSRRTIERDWSRARAYLYRELQPVGEAGPPNA
ncbi:MAG: sigma-70 family RNA polymerase sigma factor [Gemmatimonadota bacterium]